MDAFEIISTSGLVLWSRHRRREASSTAQSPAQLVNTLIRDVFIEDPDGAGARNGYQVGGYTLRWTLAKELGLVFVVCSWADFRT